ncbi:MAG: hypothetical protein QOE36_3152 [Gaiellaceae bacterium]|nr:hypothetical protein [Gaiellaceae bacterium]
MSKPLSEKGSVPIRYWMLWWSILVAALLVFYVILTPLWMGLRGLAWLAELNSRRRR